MTALETLTTTAHESVSFFRDRESGLSCIIAVHDTSIGPSLGGCRLRPYSNLEDALADVLNLSEAMSYKNALCGIPFGGGKSVIVSDGSNTAPREALFASFGARVDSLNGRYIAAEDMGTTVKDMESIGRRTKWVAGTDPLKGGGGDPSPYTARAVFRGILVCLERVFGSSDPAGRRVAIQGVGHVGHYLAKELADAGAKLIVTDYSNTSLDEVKRLYGAEVVSPDGIYDVDADVFAPCAVGGTVNETTVPRLRCKIVAGAANNQINLKKTEEFLRKRGILYAPDFVINAGGVILCADEFEPGGYTLSRVMERVDRIPSTVAAVLDRARDSGQLAGEVALHMAREIIQAARSK